MVRSLLLAILLSIWIVADALQPLPRWNHATVLINNKLYLFGGQVGRVPYNTSSPFLNPTDNAELWILDMTQPFDTTAPPWTSGPSGGPQTAFMTTNYGGPQYELLVIYGDSPNSPPPANDTRDVHYYNVTSSQWIVPTSSGSSHPLRRAGPTVVNRLNDSLLIMYAGTTINSDHSVTQSSDMWSLDTIRNIWTLLSPIAMPQPRYDHTSTLLSDGKMYVIGGYSGSSMVDMNQINIFDTSLLSWSVQHATGDVIAQRRIHKAVGTSDNKVVIFGGTDQNYTTFYNDVAVLDCTNLSWKSMSTSGPAPAGRYSHAMTMVGTNIIITYGATTSWNTDVGFFVLDTSSTPYAWKNGYTPQNLDKTLKTPPPFSSNGDPYDPSGTSTPGGTSAKSGSSTSSWVIPVVAIVGAGILVGLLIGLFLFLRKIKRDRDEDFIGFPASDMATTDSINSRPGSLRLPYEQVHPVHDTLVTKPGWPRQ